MRHATITKLFIDSTPAYEVMTDISTPQNIQKQRYILHFTQPKIGKCLLIEGLAGVNVLTSKDFAFTHSSTPAGTP